MIDIGANLAHESFHPDLEAVLQRAWDAGLERIIVTGSCKDSARQALNLARRYPQRLFATAGLHPHHAAQWSADYERIIRELAADPGLVSLGECGLDYFRNISEPAAQRRAFEAQIGIAIDLGRPLFLHQRDAHTDFLSMIRQHRQDLGNVCVHCFTDTLEAAEDYLALDCHIGITGWICDERRGGHLKSVVPRIPQDRLMVETDAPYLLPRNIPRPLRPRNARRNEPAFLPYVVQMIADARGQTPDTIADITRDNARRFFNLPDS